MKLIKLVIFHIIFIFIIGAGLSLSQEEEIAPFEEEDILGEEEEPVEMPILRIERKSDNLFSMEFRNVDIADLLRILAHEYQLNILVDKDVKGKVTASFSNISLEEALEAILRNNNLIAAKEGNITKIHPNLISKTFVLKYMEAIDMLRGEEDEDGEDDLELAEEGEACQKENTIFDLLSEDGKVFLGKLPNSLLVIDYPPNVQKVEEYIRVIDRKVTSKVFKLKYLSAAQIVGAYMDEEEGEGEGAEEEAAPCD